MPLDVDIEKRFPNGPVIRAAFRQALEGFSITVLFGRSGSGKTTVLRSVAGLERPDRGSIRFGDEVWFDAARGIDVPPQRRVVGYLSQDYALFPHLTVSENIGYALRDRPPAARRARVEELLTFLQIDGLGDRRPSQISGGQQQRVALARAVARRPRLLLLDEPLSALDGPSRDDIRPGLRQLIARFAVPAQIVTHDRAEAMALADDMVVLEAGEVRQHGRMQDVFSHPVDSAVARLVGIETVAPGRVVGGDEGLVTVEVGRARVVAVGVGRRGAEVAVCIHASDVLLFPTPAPPGSARNRWAARVLTVTPEGPLVRARLDAGFDLTALVTREAAAELDLREGRPVTAVVKAPSVRLIEERDGGA
jgi:molybdate transport system ATP-binding protein